MRERPPGVSIIAGTGSNDTRHAVHLTERAGAVGVDAVLSVTPYYNRPNRRGIIAHFSEVARASAVPVILYNIPSRTGTDMPNDLLAELAQIERIDYVKQANDDNLAPVDGLRVYSGNCGSFARALDLGEAGGIVVSSHVGGPEMKRMVEQAEHRAQIDASLRDVYETLFMTTSPICTKAALGMLGHPVGGLRLPLVEADEHEYAAVHMMLLRHGLLAREAA